MDLGKGRIEKDKNKPSLAVCGETKWRDPETLTDEYISFLAPERI